MSNAIEQPVQAKPQTWIDKLDDHAFAQKHPEWWKLIKWMLSGFIANVPELAVHMLLCTLFTAWSVTYLPNFFLFNFLAEHNAASAEYTLAAQVYAYMISTAVGYTIAFIVNRKATFHADSNIALSTFLYIIMVIFTIFMNGMIGPALSNLLGRLPFNKSAVEAISKFLSMMIPGIWSYPANRFLIHRKKKEPVAEEEAA